VSEIRSALIVGTGLIGTSVALALRGQGVVVHLTDRDPNAVRRAANLGAGDPAIPTSQVDLAVVAVAPSATASVVSGLLASNVAATVVDTAGVKADILRDVRATVGDAVHFVGTHPMAGRERSGPGAARADLFDGRTWVVVPDGVDPVSLARAEELVRCCGGVVVRLDAATHDDAVALVSMILTATPDLHSEFPALAARQLGIGDVPLLCAQEIDVVGAMPRVIRVMMHLESDLSRSEIRHVYLRGAAALRRDLAQ
jgi:monofunctional chorismate mutase